MDSRDDAEIRRLIAEVPFWYHQFEFRPGVTTSGIHPSAAVLRNLDEFGLPKDAKGLRVLDVGCCDGYYAFELERRGADVVAMDYAPAERTGFPTAAKILGSGLTLRTKNIYDLRAEDVGVFDMVLMLGLLYHLRHPVLAFDAVRGVIRTGGTLFVETQAMAPLKGATSDSPLWQYLPRNSFKGDYTNKWAVSLAGLAAVVADSEFEVQSSVLHDDRAYVRAIATEDWYLSNARSLDRSAGDPGSRGKP